METWVNLKDIVPEGGSYAVSNCGRVKNVKTGRILANSIGSHGYYMVTLCCEDSKKKYLVHRLEMMAFTPQPNGKTIVNHIDGNKLNNVLANLEWTDYTENNRHAWVTGLMDREVHRKAVSETGRKAGPKNIKFAHEANKKPVSQISVDGKIINEFSCARDAEKLTGVPHQTISRQCVTDARKKLRFHNFYFRFSENARREAIN